MSETYSRRVAGPVAAIATETSGIALDAPQAFDLLGGVETIKLQIRSAIEAHDILARGLPSQALIHLVERVAFLDHGDALTKAVGVSLRTLQRRRHDTDDRLLSPEQSSRTWRFAEILAQAIGVMGSQQAAEDWMNRPAIGLDNRKPVDLLATSAGVEAVAEYLTRLEYGVYA